MTVILMMQWLLDPCGRELSLQIIQLGPIIPLLL